MHEAVKLARAFGLDPELLHQVSAVNGAITPSMATLIRLRNQLEKQGEAALQSAFGPHGALGKKDMAAALQSAKKFKVSLPGAEKTEELIADVFVNRY
jgi:3-hydroxyisobutyrate dehydrogenase-like beta-hydroxyacid dehydrogenase